MRVYAHLWCVLLRQTHLTALVVIVLVVVHGLFGRFAFALLDLVLGADGSVDGLVGGCARVLDGVAHDCGFGGVFFC